ncbi:MAG TPA: ABC transporter permease [Verrucomicrobiota bacterium]|nr:ABC transporter permease [Verrucomicrobiota bacterium]
MDLDLRVLGFASVLSLLTGLTFGLAPAWSAAQTRLNESLKDSARGSTEGRRRRQVRAMLVVTEVGLAVVLLTGAGLLLRSFAQVQSVDSGYRTERVLTGMISLPDSRYPKDADKGAFMMRVAERLAALPGVEHAGLTMGLPLGVARSEITLNVEGQPELARNESNSAGYNQVTPDFFPALGIQILSGRNFDRRDGTNSPFVALVNESFVRTFLKDGQPIGRRLHVSDSFETNATEIVGIVRDVRHLNVAQPPVPEMYFPMAQRCWGLGQLAVRVQGEPMALSEAVRRAVGELDSEQPVHALRPMETLVDDSLANRRFQTLVLLAFAVGALLLAAVGIYGVMAYGVSQRTHEIGVRMSLGAESGQVLGMILGQGMRMAGLGIGLGLVGALALTRIIQGLLYEVSPRDPLTFALIPLVLLIVAALACLLPALRAARVDPMVALRAE